MIPELTVQEQVEARNKFINQQELTEGVNPLVAESWRRCWARLNPNREKSIDRLSSEHFLATQVAGFNLISLARPIMEDIYQYIEGSNCLVMLTNGAGYVLDLLGDPGIMDYCQKFGIVPGAHISEEEMGTNAFSVSIFERSPARVSGPEHYLDRFQELAEAAAPIFDLTGRPLGSLGIITTVSEFHTHTLGLVVAGARAVEGQWQTEILLAEQHSNLDKLNGVLEASNDGILVFDQHGALMLINDVALRIFGVRRGDVLGRVMDDGVSYPSFVKTALKQGDTLTDAEITVKIDSRLITLILSLRYLYSEKVIKWVIATVRQEKDVRDLVHSQAGALAPLTLDDIPGKSEGIQRVQRFVRSTAPAKASILIKGESGTGKNVLASAIHNASPRNNGPFLIFGCSSIPHEWVVSELLGYDESVSSNKPGGRPSKFELADGGTIFFQNVDDLPLDAQAILLNVLDLGIIQRLGSARPISVDVRVIASTSGNCEKLIAQGDLRSDLYYRLSSFEVTLPPLRSRMVDLPELAYRILDRISRQLGKIIQLDQTAMEILKGYQWPGNLRELEAVLGRAAVRTNSDGIIGKETLPVELLLPVARDGISRVLSLRDIERETIMNAAESCHGNVTEMARVLGIGRTTMWRRTRDYSIPLEKYRNK